MSAWSRLVHDHHATVYRVALGVLRDPAAAEDVAQDVFLSLLRNPSAISRAENLRSVVCRAALNRALDVRKAGLRRAARETAVSERSSAVDPLETLFRHELREKVAELPEIHRQAVDLHFFQGLTIAETAEVLDVPRGTASRRLSDAIATLRQWLSAAAFVALLAKLESELSRVEAAPVPAGLEKRLLDLPRTHGAEPRQPLSRGAKGAIAVAVAFLFAVSTGQWIRARDARWNAEAPRPVHEEVASGDVAESASELPTDVSAGTGPSAAPLPASVSDVAMVTEVEETIEGFLFRTPEGLFLAGEVVPDPAETTVLRTGEHRPSDGRVWRLSGGGLDGWPASDTANFTAFLYDGAAAGSAPHTRVRLKVRSSTVPLLQVLEPGNGPDGKGAFVTWKALYQDGVTFAPAEPGSESSRTMEGAVWSLAMAEEGSAAANSGPPSTELREFVLEGGELVEGGARYTEVSRALLDELKQRVQRVDPPPAAATVLEVLEVESLTDGWLEAWRDLYVAAHAVLCPEASQGDRAADAARLGDALQHARLARAGQSPAVWRIRMENRFAAGAVAALAADGLSAFLPGMPTQAELSDLFLKAGSPEELRMILTARWGEDVLCLTVPACVSRNAVDGTLVDVSCEPHALAELTALTPEEFRATVELTRSLQEKTVQNW